MMNVKINNLPDYAQNYKYIVATLVDDELWFWGAYDDYKKAKYAANETFDRLIIDNSEGFLNEDT